MQALRDRFAALCRIGTPTLGRITASDEKKVVVYSEWTTRSPEMKKSLVNGAITVVDPALSAVLATTNVAGSISETQTVARSSNNTISAILTVITDGKDKKHYVHSVDETSKATGATFNLNAKKLHGNIHRSGEFGGLLLNPTGTHLLYTAERLSKPSEFFDGDPEAKQVGEKFLWKESFGESLPEVVDPVVCSLELAKGEVTVFDTLPEGLFPLRKIFSPDGKSVVVDAIQAPYFKLGHVYCTNRLHTIGKFNLADKKFTKIAADVQGVEALFYDPGGKLFVFSRKNKLNAHQGVYGLYEVPEDGKLVDTGLPDVFLPAVAERSFAADGSLIFSALIKAQTTVQRFDFKSKKLNQLSPLGVSDVLLDVQGSLVLVQRSSSTVVPELQLGKISTDGNIKWQRISQDSKFEINHSLLEIGTHSFVLVPDLPPNTGPLPLVAIIHGGPHSSCLQSWPRRTALLLLQLGYAVLQTNYPGSIGYDEPYVQQLPGKVGELDVAFIEKAIDDTFKELGTQLATNRLAIVGGSHGGYLVTTLGGKNPDRYKAIVSLNPVLNLRTMYDITDIPDWCAFEAASAELPTGNIPPAVEAEMLKRSPIVHAPSIKAPYLLAIGGKDLRVPPHFRSLVRQLRSNKVPNKVLFYPDSNHALGEVDVEADVVINSALWISQYI